MTEMTQGSGEGVKSLYEAVIEDYKPEVIEELRYRYAKTILSTKDLDNLQWAKEFMDAYERKRSLLNKRKHKVGEG